MEFGKAVTMPEGHCARCHGPILNTWATIALGATDKGLEVKAMLCTRRCAVEWLRESAVNLKKMRAALVAKESQSAVNQEVEALLAALIEEDEKE